MRRARERLKCDEAFVLQAVLLQRRQAATAWPARPRAPARRRPAGRLRRRGCRSRSPRASAQVGEEIAADLARSTRCTGCCRARSAPARPWWRCARCCRWSTPAARPRCSRPPRCSPSSTTARSASMLGDLAAGRHARRRRRAPGRAAHRLAWAPPRAGRRCSTPPPATAGIVVGTHALLQEHGPVPRPGAGRGRRAAPVRRRAARRAARARPASGRRTCWS